VPNPKHISHEFLHAINCTKKTENILITRILVMYGQSLLKNIQRSKYAQKQILLDEDYVVYDDDFVADQDGA